MRQGQEPLAVRAARASLWSVAGQGGQQFVGVLSFVLLTRWLSPSDYGLAGMAAAVSSVLAIAGDTGVVAGLARQREIDGVAEATGFWVSLGGSIVLAAATAAAAPILSWYFSDDRIGPLSVAMGLNFVLSAPGRVPTAKLVKQLQFSLLARLSFAASVCGLVLGAAVACRGGGAWAIYAQTAATLGVQTVLLVAIVPYHASRREFSKGRAAELAAFGSGMTGFLLALTMARSGDAILGGRLVGPQPLGLLSMATKLGGVPVQRLSSAVASVFMPAHLEIAEEGRGAAFARALTLTEVVTFPVSLGVFAVAPEVVAFLPDRWFGLVPTLRILALGTLVEPIAWFSFAVLSGEGRTRELLKLGLTLVPIGWAGSLLGALGGSGAWLATAWAVWNVIYALAMANLVWKPLGLGQSPILRGLVPLLAGLAMVGGVRAVLSATDTAGRAMGLLVGATTGVVIYGVALVTVMRDELNRLVDLTKGAFKRRPASRRR